MYRFELLKSPFCKRCCGDHDCSIWATIVKKTEDGKWCLKWLRQLKDFEASHGLPDADHQVSLMVDHTDNEVRHIRSTLAFLQEQMPVWKIIDQIHEQAEAKAVRFRNELHEVKLKRNDFDSYELTASSEESALDLSDNQAVTEAKMKVDYDKQTKLILRAKRERYYNILRRYVRAHIKCMLKRLYSNLKTEEEDLQTIFAEDGAIDQVTDEIWQLRVLKEKNSKIGRQLELEKYWFGVLYRVPDVNSINEVGSRSTNEADSISPKSKNCLRIVGPVGERPLHVCALLAFRFASVNFEGEGNYLSEGILQGMMKYIESESGKPGDMYNLQEWRVPYGKDYCAAVGNFLLKDEKHTCGKRMSNLEHKTFDPPHWPQICKWKRAHMTNGMSRIKSCLNLNAPDWYAKTLVMKGLYEGETILFPLIAGKAEDIIRRLLKRDREDSESLLLKPVEGLFFHPRHRRCLTSASVWTGWKYYANVRYRDMNLESSTERSYFGRSALFFAASQGDIAIFNLLFFKITEILGKIAKQEGSDINVQMIQKNLVNVQDRYGNTLLHVAAWNEMTAIYDRLIQLGANREISNRDGLTPFTLTARLGIWSSFNHIWDKHLTKTVWQFGNVTRHKSDYKSFDWKGIKTFLTWHEVRSCKEALLEIFSEISPEASHNDYSFNLSTPGAVDDPEILNSLRFKHRVVCKAAKDWGKYMEEKKALKFIEKHLNGNKNKEPSDGLFDEHHKETEMRSAIRMITLFRPEGWYNHTKEKLEKVVLDKWSNGYHLVHLGQSLLPYCVVILIFGLMWWKRELHILQHNLWWATPEATIELPPDQTFRNPVVADIPELLQLTDELGTWAFQNGRLPPEAFGEESKCGWRAIRDSTSGRLQAVQAIYGVFSLLRLAYSQRRVRPSDWDQNEDTIISADETVNFIYLNLEVFLHIILSGLFMTIGIARVAAGEKCIDYYVQIEKSSMAVTALFLFANLFTVGKPYKGIGLLVLTTYKFIVSDVFNFIIMYCTFFAGFLLALQTMYNSERVYLAWLDLSPAVFSQVKAITNGSAYLVNSDMPDGSAQLLDTQMNMDGCSGFKMPIYATAWMLLQISVGDGLADSIKQMQQSDFECAGFQSDPIIFYILVLWVFLTNVLILNMLIAMMNYTFDRQKKTVSSVWLLDLSYRIMRFERLFPELIDRMQTRHVSYSFWRFKFWHQLFLDCCLVVYCVPEVHLRGISHKIYVWLFRTLSCKQNQPEPSYTTTVQNLIESVKEKRKKQALASENDVRVRALVQPIESEDYKSKAGCMNCNRHIQYIKGHLPEQRLKSMMMLPEVVAEVNKWYSLSTSGKSETSSNLKLEATLVYSSALHSLPQKPSPFYPMPQKEPCCLPLPVCSAADSDSEGMQHSNYLDLGGQCLSAEEKEIRKLKAGQDIQQFHCLPAVCCALPVLCVTSEALDQEGQLPRLKGHEANTLNVATQHEAEAASVSEHKQSIDWEKLLLVISIVYRLHLLQEEHRGSCMVISTSRPKSGRAAAQSIYNKDNGSDYCTDTDTD